MPSRIDVQFNVLLGQAVDAGRREGRCPGVVDLDHYLGPRIDERVHVHDHLVPAGNALERFDAMAANGGSCDTIHVHQRAEE
jgi:hypothetical protein